MISRGLFTLSAGRLILWVGLLCASIVGPQPLPGLAYGFSTPPSLSDAPSSSPPYAPGEVLIGWRVEDGLIPGASSSQGWAGDRASSTWRRAAEVVRTHTGLPVLDVEPRYGLARLAVPKGHEAREIARLQALPWVAYAEPNYLAWAASDIPQGIDGYPDDPFIGEQWNMRRIGAPEAWDVTAGSPSLVVAVIDTGVDLDHPEFASRLLQGYDYVNRDFYPDDDHGHGTHVAGILAAAANNGIGVTGVAPNVRILPLKVLNAQRVGYYSDVATAIRAAADLGAQIINLSLGGMAQDQTLRNAVDYAAGRNVLVLAAAGNEAQAGNPNFYPAAYASGGNIMAVAASDHFDNWASYSGYKPYVTLAAPGGISGDQIWSTTPGSFGFSYGTSMATALASGAAALAWTLAPTATNAQIADLLKNTADKVGGYAYSGGRNDYFGFGRLNVARAVRWAVPPALASALDRYHFLLSQPSERKTAVVRLLNPSGQPVSWQASVLEGTGWLSVAPAEGTATFTAPGMLSLAAGPSNLAPGYYDGVVQVRVIGDLQITFEIYVLLHVSHSLHLTYLPGIANQMAAAAWIDPLASGQQPLALTNEELRQIILPFPLFFYGRSYRALWVSDNGLVFFGDPRAGTLYQQITCLPTATFPNDAIYAYWQDWRPDLGGQVYAGSAPDGSYVVTWQQMRRSVTDMPQSFQLVLLRDSRLLLQYQSVQSPLAGTVGIENFDGTIADQVSCDGVGRPIRDGDALILEPKLPW